MNCEPRDMIVRSAAEVLRTKDPRGCKTVVILSVLAAEHMPVS